MGRIIQDGFTFVQYANAGLIRKIDDIPTLKHELIARSEEKTHPQMARYALLLGRHVLDMSGVQPTSGTDACFAIVERWLAKEVPFQAALEVAGELNARAREEKHPVKTKVLRAFGQVAATPHVRWHALVASEYAVVVTNLLYPKDMRRVQAEREAQIALMQDIEAAR